MVYLISIGLTLIFAFLGMSFPPDKQQEIVNSAPKIAIILLVISALFIIVALYREMGKSNV